MSTSYGQTGPAAGEYSAEDDNQLQPEDTLIDRGVSDVLDEDIRRPSDHMGAAHLGHWKTSTSCLQKKNMTQGRG